MKNLPLCLLFFFSPLILISQQKLVECGFTAMTCFSGYNSNYTAIDPNGYVLALHDVRALTNSVPTGDNSVTPNWHEPQWTEQYMGQIYGLAIDAIGNIYATSTKVYGNHAAGPAGEGGVYKIDAFTGAVTNFATLPNTGSGLGNICYDPVFNQLFITNFEDGKIYRYNMAGALQSTYDHNGPTIQTNPPFIDLGERPWGIAFHNNRIYYGMWNEDATRPSSTVNNEVWSIALTGGGNFDFGTEQCETEMPVMYNNWSSPISDISFSAAGRMLIGERSVGGDIGSSAHSSRILEFNGTAPFTNCNPVWGAPQQILIGNYGVHVNSSGGVDYGYGNYDSATDVLGECDQIIWGTGDALKYSGYNDDASDNELLYGFAGMPYDGNSPVSSDPDYVKTSSYYVDADGNLSSSQKTQLGDIELFFCGCPDDCHKDPTTKTFSTIINSEMPQNTQFDFGYSGIQDSDSDEYLICGESRAYFNQDVFVNNLDATGTVTNSMICDLDFTFEGARWMDESFNNPNLGGGGYFYTGSHNLNASQDLLFKVTDKAGAIQSATIFDPNNVGSEIGYEVIEDRNGDYVAVGKRIRNNNQLSAYAVGLDANFNTKWAMEYFLDGFAWSVTEIEYPVSPNVPGVYAITGVSRTEVFVMLINAADGTNILGGQIFTYDLDSDLATREVGHSIDVDQNNNIIITGTANRASLSTNAQRNLLFVMQIPLANLVPGSATPGAFNYVYFHDILNSNNEIARHITTTDDNDYIITGRSLATDDDNDVLEQGHAFILSIKEDGFTHNWINEYTDPQYRGSNGERVEVTSDGGCYMTGSIWNFEPDPTGALVKTFDKFAVKTDEKGLLYDCDCCNPIEVEAIAPDSKRSLKQFDFSQDQIPEPIDYRSEIVEVKQDHCDQYCPPAPCDITTTFTIDMSNPDTCCIVSLDLTNGMSTVYGIRIDIIAGGVFFDLATINATAPLVITPGLTSLVINHMTPGTAIPTGFINDYLTFCYGISSGSSSAQTIMITYYDQFGNLIVDCRDIIDTECVVDPPEDDCFDVIVTDIDCVDDNVFKMTFNVQNNSGQTLGDITFFPVGAGIFVLPAPLTITPSVLDGNLSAPQCLFITTAGPFPKLIDLTYSMVDVNGQFCCNDNDTLSVLLPNCCSPCDEPQEEFVRISTTSTAADSCCHSLDIINPCDYNLVKIQTEVITPGVTFSSTSIGGGYAGTWTLNNISTTVSDYVPNAIPAPSGTYNDLVEFCLDNPSNVNPQEVAVHYYISDGMGGEEILCSDTLRFVCEIDEKCLEVLDYNVYCDPSTGKFYLDFCIENVSMPPFTASELALYIPPPFNSNFAVSPNIFTGLSYGPGDIICQTVEISGIPLPASGDVLKVQFEMHRNIPGVPYECCDIREEICITLPPCGCDDPNDPHCCDDVSVESKRIPGNWCFNTEFTNNAGNDFDLVQACIITPNRAFGSVSANGAYTVTSGSPTVLNVTHGIGNIPTGTTDVMDFCLIKTGGLCPFWGCTTTIEYKWIKSINGQSVIVCRDTVRYRCNNIIDIAIDDSKCVDDVISRTSVDDFCIDYTVLPSDLLDTKIGLMFEVITPGVSITDLNLNPGINPNAVQEDGGTLVYFDMTMIDLSVIQGALTEMCYSDIPTDGLEMMVHWIDESLAGNVTRCSKKVTLKQCPNGSLNQNPIPSGEYHFDKQMNTVGRVLGGSGVSLKAGQEIVFDPGFEIQIQATMTASIKACIIVEED